jgi:purine-binding chemotaxis protein CheW
MKPSGQKLLYATFRVGKRLYGIDVTRVQEITKALPCTRVPLAPKYVIGLINLRGQIATAVDLKELFDLKTEPPVQCMSVFCEIKGSLLSLIVDEVGDVVEVDDSSFEDTPDTVPRKIKSLMSGVYKIPGDLLSILEVDKITDIVMGNKQI